MYKRQLLAVMAGLRSSPDCVICISEEIMFNAVMEASLERRNAFTKCHHTNSSKCHHTTATFYITKFLHRADISGQDISKLAACDGRVNCRLPFSRSPLTHHNLFLHITYCLCTYTHGYNYNCHNHKCLYSFS